MCAGGVAVLLSLYPTMRPLSATECISPAIERTKLVLFTPFRKGRTWKLCATAYLCRGGTIFFPFPLISLALVPLAKSAGGMPAVVVLVAVLFALSGLFFLWLFHLCSRLQFAFFDIVANRGDFVAPAWRKYGPQSLAWTGVKVLLGCVATLATAAPLVALFHRIAPIFAALRTIQPGQPPPLRLIGAFYAGYGVLLLIFGTLYLVSSLLTDFILPSLALEDTGMAEAFRRMVELIRREPGEFILYTVLKVVLGMAAYMGAVIAWEIAFILVTLILALVVFAIGFVLHLIGVPSVVLSVLGFLVAFAWYLFIAFYSLLLAVGPVLTFLDAYAVYFVGGRYPLLGDLLDKSTPPPAYPYSFTPPPLYPPPPPTGLSPTI